MYKDRDADKTQPNTGKDERLPLRPLSTVHQVASPEDLTAWFGIFSTSFPDDAMYYDLAFFQSRLEAPTTSSRTVLLLSTSQNPGENQTKPSGFRWLRLEPDEPDAIGYVPFGGVNPEYEGKGVYSALVKTSEQIFIDHNIPYVTAECEDPEAIGSGDSREHRMRRAQRRLGVFTGMDYSFVNPGAIPYLCPKGDDPDSIDRRYLLGVKNLDTHGSPIEIKDDTSFISKGGLWELYTRHMKLLTNSPNRASLEKKYRSVQEFYRLLDQYPLDKIPFLSIPTSREALGSPQTTSGIQVFP